MVVAESKLSRAVITNRAKVAVVFLLSGLISGLISAWLTSTPKLRAFFFVKSDKFLLPTYKYWTAFGVLFTLALVVAYVITRRVAWLNILPSTARLSWALFIAVASPVALYLSTHAKFFISAVYYVVFLPLAMCIMTARLRLLALAILQNIFVLIAALIVMYVGLSLVNGLSETYEYVQTGIAESLFAAAFGSWLTWVPTRFYERTA